MHQLEIKVLDIIDARCNHNLIAVEDSLGLEDEMYNSKPAYSLLNDKVRSKEYRS